MPSVEQVQCHSVFILPWKEVTRDEHQEQHLSSTAPGASQVFSTSFCLSLSPKSEGNTENGTRLATIQMEKSATFTLESCPLAHSSHWRANLQEKPLGWQEKEHHSGAAG